MSPNEEPSGIWWLYLFLARTFFSACSSHNILENHKNRYCIDCDMEACNHCLAEGTHADHRVMKIYRHVYQDAVTLEELSKHIDCSGIQPYVSNKKAKVSLHPLPHKYSGSLKQHISCSFCTRKLMDPKRFKFCSIACKYQINNGEPKTKEAVIKPPAPQNGRKRPCSGAGRRKGVPFRAPFF